MKVKKIAAVVLSACLTLTSVSVLTGCGKKKNAYISDLFTTIKWPDSKLAKMLPTPESILPMMFDSDMAVQEIYNLVVYDTTISDGVKQKLTVGYPFSNSKEKADFLSAVLCFSMERSFIEREAGSKKLTAGKALSPIVNDVIFGADVPKPCRYFCGRDKGLDALHDQLSENSKIFLQGIPGIGKSELAKAYAKKHKKDYTNIIYLNYSGSLKADIVNLDFADDYNASEPEAERFRRHARFLRSLKDDSLIIIDNFNAIATDDGLLSEVLAYSCRILFTTRSRFDDYDTYTIEEMLDDVLLELMGKLFTDADKYQAILSEIIHTVHGHTFAVELAARLLEVGLLKPKQVFCRKTRRPNGKTEAFCGTQLKPRRNLRTADSREN